MAGSLSNYAEDKVLQWLTGKATATVPSSVTAKLFVGTMPADTGTGADAPTLATGFTTNPTTTAASWTNTSLSTDAAQTYTYGASLTWTRDSSGFTDNGAITGVGLYDGTNLLAWTDFASSKTIGAGESLTISANTLKISLN